MRLAFMVGLLLTVFALCLLWIVQRSDPKQLFCGGDKRLLDPTLWIRFPADCYGGYNERSRWLEGGNRLLILVVRPNDLSALPSPGASTLVAAFDGRLHAVRLLVSHRRTPRGARIYFDQVWGVHLQIVPTMIGAFIPATALLLWRPLRSRIRRSRGLCHACGYDLRGSATNRCPECGSERVR